MGEPNLITEKRYFQLWEQLNPLSRPYNDFQEGMIGITFAFGFGGIVMSQAYNTGCSSSGPLPMIFFYSAFALCLLLDATFLPNFQLYLSKYAIIILEIY